MSDKTFESIYDEILSEGIVEVSRGGVTIRDKKRLRELTV